MTTVVDLLAQNKAVGKESDGGSELSRSQGVLLHPQASADNCQGFPSVWNCSFSWSQSPARWQLVPAEGHLFWCICRVPDSADLWRHLISDALIREKRVKRLLSEFFLLHHSGCVTTEKWLVWAITGRFRLLSYVLEVTKLFHLNLVLSLKDITSVLDWGFGKLSNQRQQQKPNRNQ